MVKISGKARRLRIYIGESDQYKGMPLYHAIVTKAKELGLAGATVQRGVEGFGANSRVHTTRVLVLSSDLPIVIDIIDSNEYIDKILPFLDQTVTEGLITIEDMEIIKYTNRKNGST
ncbi:MAG: DUF190 domain-containing protein [Peptococcaceae bacterium]